MSDGGRLLTFLAAEASGQLSKEDEAAVTASALAGPAKGFFANGCCLFAALADFGVPS